MALQGTLDADNAVTGYNIYTYFNYLNQENYFLKASGKINGKDKGASCVGCSFRIIKTEIDGDKHAETRTLWLT